MPDEVGRQNLFELYAQGLSVKDDPFPALVRRTEGVSGAFICELTRRAAQSAIRSRGKVEVDGQNFDEALHELAVDGGAFTRSFLGFCPG